MATHKMIVVKGQKGYIPVKDNSHGGVDLGRVTNGKEVEIYTDRPEEFGWVQIVKLFDSPVTHENWVMKDHLAELTPEPQPEPEQDLTPDGEWEAYEYKFENEMLWLKKTSPKKDDAVPPGPAPS
jgi:hypothetical protein